MKLVADEITTYTTTFGACDRAASSTPTSDQRGTPMRCSGTPIPLIIHCWVHRPDIRMPRNVQALPSATTRPRQNGAEAEDLLEEQRAEHREGHEAAADDGGGDVGPAQRADAQHDAAAGRNGSGGATSPPPSVAPRAGSFSRVAQNDTMRIGTPSSMNAHCQPKSAATSPARAAPAMPPSCTALACAANTRGRSYGLYQSASSELWIGSLTSRPNAVGDPHHEQQADGRDDAGEERERAGHHGADHHHRHPLHPVADVADRHREQQHDGQVEHDDQPERLVGQPERRLDVRSQRVERAGVELVEEVQEEQDHERRRIVPARDLPEPCSPGREWVRPGPRARATDGGALDGDALDGHGRRRRLVGGDQVALVIVGPARERFRHRRDTRPAGPAGTGSVPPGGRTEAGRPLIAVAVA